jgi:hypothetical protein
MRTFSIFFECNIKVREIEVMSPYLYQLEALGHAVGRSFDQALAFSVNGVV